MKNYELLKKNSAGTGVEILELSEVLAFALGIKIKEKEQTALEQPEEDIINIKEDEYIEKELKQDKIEEENDN
jgi:hypothetical protein